MHSRRKSFDSGIATLVSAAAVLSSLLGCSSSSSAGNGAGTGTPEAGSGPFPYPAFTPSMPQVVKGGSLPVISSSTVVPVYFSGDSLQSAIDADLQRWPGSAALRALAEYGVTSSSIGPPIVLPETPATSLDAKDIQTWIQGKLDGTHPEFGPVDTATLASKIFVVFYPAATSITWFGISLCQGADEFNAGVTLPSGAVANYAVVAECSAPTAGMSQADWFASLALGGVVPEILSPDPKLQLYPSNWEFFDTDHAADALVAVAAVQVAGGCALARWTPAGAGLLAPAVPLDASLPPNAGPPLGWAVWSNKAAAAYHDPCIPDPVGPYFVSVPVTSDQVQVTLRPYAGKMDVTSKGVLVPVGTKKTVDVQLLSDGPTSGPWTVSTQLIDQADFKFSFDRTTGQNGDVLHLTITAPSTPEQGTVALYSTLEGRRTFYVFPVQSR